MFELLAAIIEVLEIYNIYKLNYREKRTRYGGGGRGRGGRSNTAHRSKLFYINVIFREIVEQGEEF